MPPDVKLLTQNVMEDERKFIRMFSTNTGTTKAEAQYKLEDVRTPVSMSTVNPAEWMKNQLQNQHL